MTAGQEAVSVIVTILNGAQWIDACLRSIAAQQLPNNVGLELCVYDDASTDDTATLLNQWRAELEKSGISLRLQRNESGAPKGVGYGRNRAIEAASGAYLCFQDIDDEMLPQRVAQQLALAREHQDALVGSRFRRLPATSTCRFSRWANALSAAQLELQIYTANGPTIVMPTWFCQRAVYERIPGGFSEAGHGTPEDLIFFYAHVTRGGRVLRTDDCLLLYRYHAGATTFSIAQATIWQLRLRHLLLNVLGEPAWAQGFTIWNAGRQGRRFFRDLPEQFKPRVRGFCDVDKNKISQRYKYYDAKLRRVTHDLPIVHFSEATPPLVICMKLDLTGGVFEANLRSLNLQEGRDYVLFS